MTCSVRAIELLSAYLISLSAVALSSDVIDVFGLPVPRQILGMSWFSALAVVAALILWPLNPRAHKRMLGAWDAAYFGTIVLWAAVGAGRGEFTGTGTLSVILAWLPPWLTAFAARMHIRQFGHADLVPAFAKVVAGLALVHLSGLVALKAGFSMPYVRPDEVVERNSISIVVVVAAFLLVLHDMWKRRQPSWWLIGMIVLGFVHARVNGTRSAELILVLLLGLQIARVILRRDWMVVWACGIGCVAIVVTVVGLAPLLDWLRQPGVFGEGDSATSTMHRAEANRGLLRLLLAHPWTGAGWEEVLYARSGRYMAHTLYLLMPTAFGLITFVPVLAATVWCRFIRPAARLTPEQAMTGVLVTTTASFINDPLAWYGLVLSLCSSLSIDGGAASDGGGTGPARRISPRDIVIHLRGGYVAGAATGLVCFAILAAWLLLRDRYVATSELEIATIGAIAAESSHEADQFIQDAVLRNNPSLRRRCSIRPLVERQALIITCKGKTQPDAVRAVNEIHGPTVKRHARLLETRVRAAELKAEVDRATLNQLNAWAASLEARLGPMVDTRVELELMSLLNRQRAALAKSLQAYDRDRHAVYPSPLVDNTQVVGRRQPWLLAFAVSLAAACGVCLALALGNATRTARLSPQ